MKKIFAVLLAVAVFAPASAMAQYKPNQKPNKPSYNGPVAHPGSNHGGIHSQPGTSVPNHGNNGGYNNGNNGHGNNSGYNNGNNGHGNNSGYNNGNSGHGNNSGYNNGNNGHGNNSGYNNGNNGHPGSYNPGHGHGHPGNHGPAVKYELMNAHRSIERAFRTVENSYFPIFMSNEDKHRMGRAIGMLSSELNNMMRLVDRRYRDEISAVALIVERAKFTMFSENDVRAAYRKIQRAENRYNLVANNFFRR